MTLVRIADYISTISRREVRCYYGISMVVATLILLPIANDMSDSVSANRSSRLHTILSVSIVVM
jgi:hypothetical protein